VPTTSKTSRKLSFSEKAAAAASAAAEKSLKDGGGKGCIVAAFIVFAPIVAGAMKAIS
jgi:hypothetical protein